MRACAHKTHPDKIPHNKKATGTPSRVRKSNGTLASEKSTHHVGLIQEGVAPQELEIHHHGYPRDHACDEGGGELPVVVRLRGEGGQEREVVVDELVEVVEPATENINVCFFSVWGEGGWGPRLEGVRVCVRACVCVCFRRIVTIEEMAVEENMQL